MRKTLTMLIYSCLYFLACGPQNAEMNKYFKDPNTGISPSVNPEEQKEIVSQFNLWKSRQYQDAVFATENNCNPDSSVKHGDKGPVMGIPKEIQILYADINQDGKTDGLILFSPDQCDGGNALMFAQIRVLILSGRNGYTTDDKYIDNKERLVKKGWLNITRVSDCSFYGIYFEYQKTDGRCCPGIQRDISINFKTGKLTFLNN
jgi:hypothetical protein